jgi:hypothetical protein
MKPITDYTMITEAANGVYFVPIRGKWEMHGFVVRAKSAEEARKLAEDAEKTAHSGSKNYTEPKFPESGAYAISELKDKVTLVCQYVE